MKMLRQALSSALVGFYGAVAGGLIGWLGTIWMWGLGMVVGGPGGFILGAVAGWRMPLRDAAILFGSCFGGLAALNWMSFAFGRSQAPDVFLAPLFVIASALL